MKLTELKVKRKSLAAEARIIKLEERKALATGRKLKPTNRDEDPFYEKYESLRQHRTVDVRDESRASVLAHHYLKDHEASVCEGAGGEVPDHILIAAARIVKQFGPHQKAPITYKEIGEWANTKDQD